MKDMEMNGNVDPVVDELLSKQTTDRSLIVTYLDRLRFAYQQWKECLPRVEVYYAVKSFSDSKFLKTLYDLGSKFDIASVKEAELCMAIGAKGSDLLSSHPYKTEQQIHEYKQLEIPILTIDSHEELKKIMKVYPEAGIMIRVVAVPAEIKPAFDMSLKFGASFEEARVLLKDAIAVGANVKGFSFHVGSEQKDTFVHSRTVIELKELFDYAKELGRKLTLLNVGGGFPSAENDQVFKDIADNIRQAIDAHFPESSGVKCIAEPGTYMSDYSSDVYVCVTGKRQFTLQSGGKGYHYYLNDGVFGLLRVSLFLPKYEDFSILSQEARGSYPSYIWGATCAGEDRVCDLSVIPELDIGEWLVRRHKGAYTVDLLTNFNNLPLCDHVYVEEGVVVEIIRK